MLHDTFMGTKHNRRHSIFGDSDEVEQLPLRSMSISSPFHVSIKKKEIEVSREILDSWETRRHLGGVRVKSDRLGSDLHLSFWYRYNKVYQLKSVLRHTTTTSRVVDSITNGGLLNRFLPFWVVVDRLPS